jgi:7-carboxy-7-deazaguanine synthase
MKILEIFYSIQGEGRKQGKPAVFIRFAGCNLNCHWCDTPKAHDKGGQWNTDQVLEKIREFPCRDICITGGEPLLQSDELEGLLKKVQPLGYSVEIETNGTMDFRKYQDNASICMDVKCPSSGEESDLSLLEMITPNDSVKFVVGDKEDCSYAERVIRTHKIKGEVFFSPVSGSDYHEITSFVLDRNLPVRIQVQLHKILGVQ